MNKYYYPDYGKWERKNADELNLNKKLIDDAVEYAKQHENKLSINNMQKFTKTVSEIKEPYDDIVGPIKERGKMTGVIIKDGYIVAEWGDIERVDMTFSVTKTYLSTTVGLAYDKGLIGDIHDKVYKYMPGEHFNNAHNKKITWDHLLRQTSEWQGVLWGKPDWADRPPSDISIEDLSKQNYQEPGTKYKYNDVRVNLLALVMMNLWREPLPKILKQNVMDPIGASNTWRWYGYDNSWVLIDGQKIQSVSGGGHWGGGMFINAIDHARFGYLFLRNGLWKDDEIISQDWIKMASSPSLINQWYGYMNWFLNANNDRINKVISSAPSDAVYFSGLGSNIIYIDWENDLVVVVRWIDSHYLSGFIDLILKSLK